MSCLIPIPDEWLIGYSQALAKEHPDWTARQRLVEAVRVWREQEGKAYAVETRREER